MNLRGHWRYLLYVLRHKWFVYREGRNLGLGRWQLLVHDLSKFSRAEWGAYVAKFYGPKATRRDSTGAYDPNASDEAFKAAWRHHWMTNPHHWEQWAHFYHPGLMTKPVEVDPQPMLDEYRREMLADWRGAGLAQGKGDDVREFYEANGAKMRLHPETRAWVEQQLYGRSYTPVVEGGGRADGAGSGG